MSRFIAEHGLDGSETTILGTTLKRLGIRPEQFPVIVEQVPLHIMSDDAGPDNREKPSDTVDKARLHGHGRKTFGH
jgi:hypothetical protein